MEKITLGKRALTRRKELKLTQRELAKRVGVAHVTISQWERDDTEPVGKRLFALAKGLDCSPTWLLFGDEEQAPSSPTEDNAKPILNQRHLELIDLFDSLPESEQVAQIEELRARVENFNKLFDELLKARKNKIKNK